MTKRQRYFFSAVLVPIAFILVLLTEEDVFIKDSINSWTFFGMPLIGLLAISTGAFFAIRNPLQNTSVEMLNQSLSKRVQFEIWILGFILGAILLAVITGYLGEILSTVLPTGTSFGTGYVGGVVILITLSELLIGKIPYFAKSLKAVWILSLVFIPLFFYWLTIARALAGFGQT